MISLDIKCLCIRLSSTLSLTTLTLFLFFEWEWCIFIVKSFSNVVNSNEEHEKSFVAFDRLPYELRIKDVKTFFFVLMDWTVFGLIKQLISCKKFLSSTSSDFLLLKSCLLWIEDTKKKKLFLCRVERLSLFIRQKVVYLDLRIARKARINRLSLTVQCCLLKWIVAFSILTSVNNFPTLFNHKVI